MCPNFGPPVVAWIMHLAAPHLAILSPAEGGVLAVLTGTDRPLSGREIARIGRQPRSTVARVLHRLVEHGLVDDVARLARDRPPVVGELTRDAITLLSPPAHQLLEGDVA